MFKAHVKKPYATVKNLGALATGPHALAKRMFRVDQSATPTPKKSRSWLQTPPS